MALTSPPILAHGALGYWDELIFLGVGVLFIGMMIVSWLRNRGTVDAASSEMPQKPKNEIGRAHV